MDKFKNWLILGLSMTIVILLLLSQCNSPKPKDNFIKGKEIIKHDTIMRPYKVVEFKKVPYPKWDTSYVDSSKSLPHIEPNVVREYNDSTVDSSISMYRHLKVIGMIKEEKYSYWLKVPIGINTTISRTDTLVRPSKWQVFVNGEIGGNMNQINLYPGATLVYKKVEIGYSYGVLDKTHNIRMGYRLFKSKK